ncbi:ChaN family lipoprotein, partial [Rhodovulum sp.]|uniref:ChaN family lipoprotein n=1 Tax=Rhodovulum sp. TaxID=34009 RepID=UPI00185373A5
FVRAQEVWDRAFATRIRAVAAGPDAPLMIGIIGMGHLLWGGGVPWQLADLGMTNVRVAIPQDADDPPLAAGAADAVFVLRRFQGARHGAKPDDGGLLVPGRVASLDAQPRREG